MNFITTFHRTILEINFKSLYKPCVATCPHSITRLIKFENIRFIFCFLVMIIFYLNMKLLNKSNPSQRAIQYYSMDWGGSIYTFTGGCSSIFSAIKGMT